MEDTTPASHRGSNYRKPDNIKNKRGKRTLRPSIPTRISARTKAEMWMFRKMLPRCSTICFWIILNRILVKLVRTAKSISQHNNLKTPSTQLI